MAACSKLMWVLVWGSLLVLPSGTITVSSNQKSYSFNSDCLAAQAKLEKKTGSYSKCVFQTMPR